MNRSDIDLSVAITIYNSASTIPRLVDETLKNLKPIGCRFEVILIDDGSTDFSWSEIEKQCAAHAEVKAASLSRNFGQQMAVSAGIHLAQGESVIVMDGDLQNPPEAIPQLYKKLLEGYDIVYATSKTRNDFISTLTSRAFYFALKRIFKVEIIRDQLMMRIMSRRFCECYKLYPEIKRTVAAIAHDIGMSYSTLQVENRKRPVGKSGYSFLRRFSLFVDVVLSLTTHPLDVVIYLGLFALLLTTGVSSYYLWRYFHSVVLPGFTATILSVFFFGSMILLTLGIMGRYLSNIYSEVRRRPLFFLKKSTKLKDPLCP